jgi:hypothetical protein
MIYIYTILRTNYETQNEWRSRHATQALTAHKRHRASIQRVRVMAGSHHDGVVAARLHVARGPPPVWKTLRHFISTSTLSSERWISHLSLAFGDQQENRRKKKFTNIDENWSAMVSSTTESSASQFAGPCTGTRRVKGYTTRLCIKISTAIAARGNARMYAPILVLMLHEQVTHTELVTYSRRLHALASSVACDRERTCTGVSQREPDEQKRNTHLHLGA